MKLAISPEMTRILDDYGSNVALSDGSKKQYLCQIGLYFNDYGNYTDGELDLPYVLKFLMKGQKDKRVYHRKSAILSLLKYMKQTGKLSLQEYNLWTEEIKNVNYKVKPRREIDTVLFDTLKFFINKLDPADDDQYTLQCMIKVEFDTASRIRALLRTRQKDVIEYQDKHALFMREKGDKRVTKIITDDTWSQLQELIRRNKQYKYFFIKRNQINDAVLDEGYFKWWYLLHKMSEKYLGETIGFHSIRRGSAIYWYRKTKSIKFVQELLNHESPETTSRYLMLEGENVKKAMLKEERSW